MKKLFILIAFTCTMCASIAADVGVKTTDIFLKPSVITQITTIPVINVMSFAMVPTVYGTYVNISERPILLEQTYKMDTWRNPDYGSNFTPKSFAYLDPGQCLQVSVNNSKDKSLVFTNSYINRLKYKRPKATQNPFTCLPTVRHVYI